MSSNINLENEFQGLFANSTSGTGEEELLRIASKYSMQISAKQIRALLYLELWASKTKSESDKKAIHNFINRWLELKEYNNSAGFVMKALDFISLRRFLNENSLKVNIEK